MAEGIIKEALQQFVGELDIAEVEKQRLLTMTPQNYIGQTIGLARNIRIQ